jgi:A/G-specific adenine glycosylase
VKKERSSAAGESVAQEDFAARVVAWQARHGRHDLPWQGSRDAYRIWVSEIMLQQTQVAAVIGYYARFLARFPDLGALARADVDDVMRAWSGLGYYSRARNLHRAARQIEGEHGGVFPATAAALARLPGIGRSTAAAIAGFAFGERAAILDGNVKRVLARQFGVEGYPGAAPVEAGMWALAESLLPQGDIQAYNQGLMDLGATLCVRGAPACERCPVATSCVALRTGRSAELPARKPARVLPHRTTCMLAIVDRGQVWLEKRPPAGIWGGLWSLPECADPAAAREACARAGADWHARRELPAIEHGFTHYRLTIRPVVVPWSRGAGSVRDGAGLWLALDEAAGAALPAPVKRLLVALTAPAAAGAMTRRRARPR